MVKTNDISLKLVGIIFTALLVLLVVIPGVASMFVTNHAVSLEQSVNRSQGDINAQLTRRSQLIPDLVATVKQAANYEKDTQLAVVEQRAKEDTDGSYQAGVAISAVAEAYPDLKANENYRQLMTELSMTENLIFQYRSSYNESARAYKTFTTQQPWAMILGITGYSTQNFEYTKDLSNGEYSKPGSLFE